MTEIILLSYFDNSQINCYLIYISKQLQFFMFFNITISKYFNDFIVEMRF